jgi:hypothetical protein
MYFSTAPPSVFVQSAATCLHLPQPEILVCIEEDLTLAGFCILLSTGSYRRRHLQALSANDVPTEQGAFDYKDFTWSQSSNASQGFFKLCIAAHRRATQAPKAASDSSLLKAQRPPALQRHSCMAQGSSMHTRIYEWDPGYPILKALLSCSTTTCCFGLDASRSGYLSHSSSTHQVTHYQHFQMESKGID